MSPNKPVQLKRKHLAEMYLSMLLTIIMAVLFAIYTANATTERYVEERRKASIESLVPVCTYLGAQRAVYAENPPVSDTGRALAASTDDLYIRMGCNKLPPPKK